MHGNRWSCWIRPLNMTLQRCPVLRSGVLVLLEWLMTPGQECASL